MAKFALFFCAIVVALAVISQAVDAAPSSANSNNNNNNNNNNSNAVKPAFASTTEPGWLNPFWLFVKLFKALHHAIREVIKTHHDTIVVAVQSVVCPCVPNAQICQYAPATRVNTESSTGNNGQSVGRSNGNAGNSN